MINTTRQGIAPGPCPIIDGVPQCPAPNELVCININKLFDFCFEADHFSQCFPVPTDVYGPNPIAPGATVTCNVDPTKAKVEFVSSTSAPPPSPAGFMNVTLRVIAPIVVQVNNPSPYPSFSFEINFIFYKTVVLWNPSGTVVTGSIQNTACNVNTFTDNQVCLSFDLCIIIQVTANVFLLVPAYGYCTPAPCSTLPSGFQCPPSLFPPEPPGSII